MTAVDAPGSQAETESIIASLTSNLGGTVQTISLQARWRPVRFVDLDRDGETLPLCVRGERSDTELTFPLDHEMRVQSLLDDGGVPEGRHDEALVSRFHQRNLRAQMLNGAPGSAMTRHNHIQSFRS